MNIKIGSIGIIDVEFDVDPILPLKDSGVLWHKGWDIPTYWAIDTDNNVYTSDGFGTVLNKTSIQLLVKKLEYEKNFTKSGELRTLFGMKQKLPDWVHAAKLAGWAPPKEWDESQYEL
jgi:hypothetical protein